VDTKLTIYREKNKRIQLVETGVTHIFCFEPYIYRDIIANFVPVKNIFAAKI